MANPVLDRINGGSVGPADARVTLDSVVQKTALTLGTLIIAAIGSWLYFSQSLAEAGSEALSTMTAVTLVASLTTLGLSFVISMKRNVSPPLVLLFAAIEGVFIGSFSKLISLYVGDNEPVVGAILGTLVAAASILAVYKFFNIRVSDRARRILTIVVLAMVGLSLLDLGLSFFGAAVGVNGFGAMGFLFSALGLGVGIFMLLTDFDMTERAIEMGLPEEESWRLAFGLTVSLVWIYVSLLRLLAILRGSD